MFGYLDAAAGSMIAAAIAGGGAGIAVLLRMYWHRVLGVFSKKHREAARTAADELTADRQDAESEPAGSLERTP